MSVVLFYHQSLALWFLGYPEAAVAAAQQALTRAREAGQAATLMYALALTAFTHIFCGDTGRLAPSWMNLSRRQMKEELYFGKRSRPCFKAHSSP
jgi:hypothetical protein